MKQGPAIIWFRRDLRLSDNPTLTAALDAGRPIIPLYIHAPQEDAPWSPGAASQWWLHHSLDALDRTLRKLGSKLSIFRGSSESVLQEIIDTTGADQLYWSRLYEPAAIERDNRVQLDLEAKGISCHSFNASLLAEPSVVLNQKNRPYRVFGAYWRTCSERQMGPCRPLPAPGTIPTQKMALKVLSLDQLELIPKHPWYSGFSSTWQPGETGAGSALEAFLSGVIDNYSGDRDLPAVAGTSRLSPHLHFGEISPIQIHWALLGLSANEGVVGQQEKYLSQLGWREFAHYTLYHFPESANRSLDGRFEQIGWQSAEQSPEYLAKWQRGETGIPLVDAGMRELWHTGWMHNRVRMIVASLLTKNLGIHWLEGARWFWDTLVDADLANNTMGWQWSAGCGVDAAPYFRVFNPLRQAGRFDPLSAYVDKWVPELSRQASYPSPMIDLKLSHQHALDRWSQVKGIGRVSNQTAQADRSETLRAAVKSTEPR